MKLFPLVSLFLGHHGSESMISKQILVFVVCDPVPLHRGFGLVSALELGCFGLQCSEDISFVLELPIQKAECNEIGVPFLEY